MYKTLHEKLLALSKYLGANKSITGDAITFVDFWLYETLIWYNIQRNVFRSICQFRRIYESIRKSAIHQKVYEPIELHTRSMYQSTSYKEDLIFYFLHIC